MGLKMFAPKPCDVAKEMVSSPIDLVANFRRYYGPTMNAFEAAEKSGRASDLQKELEALFVSHNTRPNGDGTSIPATYLRVTVVV